MAVNRISEDQQCSAFSQFRRERLQWEVC